LKMEIDCFIRQRVTDWKIPNLVNSWPK
jgi:hypothetical protein